MANINLPRRKPRVRKSAPTVRERVEAATAEQEAKSQKKARKLPRVKVPNPFKKLKPGQWVPVKLLGRVLRPVGKVLSWIAPRYLVNSWREVRQVQWTNRRETWRLTLAVFVFALVFGAMVAGVDKGLDELFKKVILK